MNDRLVNNPPPPRELNPEISPELQETIYRALEREPRHRYPTYLTALSEPGLAT
jgi:serine/threonine-protein kinase